MLFIYFLYLEFPEFDLLYFSLFNSTKNIIVGTLVTISDTIENFDTDDHVPSVVQNGNHVITFDFPKKLFIRQEILKVGMTKNFHQYKVHSYD